MLKPVRDREVAVLTEIVQRFAQASPISVMMRGLMELVSVLIGWMTSLSVMPKFSMESEKKCGKAWKLLQSMS